MKFVALVVIASSEFEDDLKKTAKEAGASGGTILQGRGSGYEEKKSFFSLTFEGNHSVMIYILEDKMSRVVLKALKEELEREAGDGIAFTTPISHIVGLNEKVIEKFEDNIKKEEIL